MYQQHRHVERTFWWIPLHLSDCKTITLVRGRHMEVSTNAIYAPPIDALQIKRRFGRMDLFSVLYIGKARCALFRSHRADLRGITFRGFSSKTGFRTMMFTVEGWVFPRKSASTHARRQPQQRRLQVSGSWFPVVVPHLIIARNAQSKLPCSWDFSRLFFRQHGLQCRRRSVR